MSLFQAPTDQTNDLDETKDYFTELVGDGKKFKTPQELARGKAESDNYIKLLTERMDNLRTDYLKLDAEHKAQANLQELMDQFSQKTNGDNTNKPSDDVDVPKYDLKTIEELVLNKIKDSESQRIQANNYSSVENKLKEKWGANYHQNLQTVAADLGLSNDQIENLAKTQPKLLIRTLGLDNTPQQDQYNPPPRSSSRTDNFSMKTPKRTWSYYQELRKSNPTLYHDPKTSLQMLDDMRSLGESFEDGDFTRFG